MTQLIPLDKRSKKARREYHAKQRGSWHGVNPSGDLHSGAKQEANSRNDGRRDEVCSPEEENYAG